MNKILSTKLQDIYISGMTETSAHQIAHILQEEGITSPAAFTDLLLKVIEHERRNPSPIEILGEMDPLGIDQKCNTNLKLIHRAPEMPFSFHGTMMDPNDIHRFDGKPLHFAVLGEAGEAKLIACESYREIMRLARRRDLINMIQTEVSMQQSLKEGIFEGFGSGENYGVTLKPATLFPPYPPFTVSPPGGGGFITCPKNAPCPSSEAQFFEHADFEGDWLWLAPDFIWSDLTEVGRGGWFEFGCDWNDVISSIKTGDGLLCVCEHINLEGSTYTLFGSEPKPIYAPTGSACGRHIVGWSANGRQDFASLSAIGWNDRISSVWHMKW